LPALPPVVSGLRARGGVTVDLVWADMGLPSVGLTADRAGTYRIRVPGRAIREVDLPAGKTVRLSSGEREGGLCLLTQSL
jgi:hypothetical protein